MAIRSERVYSRESFAVTSGEDFATLSGASASTTNGHLRALETGNAGATRYTSVTVECVLATAATITIVETKGGTTRTRIASPSSTLHAITFGIDPGASSYGIRAGAAVTVTSIKVLETSGAPPAPGVSATGAPP